MSLGQMGLALAWSSLGGQDPKDWPLAKVSPDSGGPGHPAEAGKVLKS